MISLCSKYHGSFSWRKTFGKYKKHIFPAWCAFCTNFSYWSGSHIWLSIVTWLIQSCDKSTSNCSFVSADACQINAKPCTSVTVFCAFSLKVSPDMTDSLCHTLRSSSLIDCTPALLSSFSTPTGQNDASSVSIIRDSHEKSVSPSFSICFWIASFVSGRLFASCTMPALTVISFFCSTLTLLSSHAAAAVTDSIAGFPW